VSPRIQLSVERQITLRWTLFVYARQQILRRYLSPCAAIHVTSLLEDAELGKVGRLITGDGGYAPWTRR